MSTLETPVAFLRNHRAKETESRPIGSILAEIRNGTHARAIRDLRQPGLSDEKRGELKRALPAIMVSGTSTAGHKATDFDQHSGFLQIDIDGIGEDKAASLRDAIGQDPHILAAFISPSGNGVKAFICIPAMKETHEAAFTVAGEYIRQRYGVEIDTRCKNITRLCFVSHDPDLVVNADAVEMMIPPEFHQPTTNKPKRAVSRDKTQRHGEVEGVREVADEEATQTNSSEFLNPEFYVLCNITEEQLGKDLLKHYRKSVARFYDNPQPGTRNKTIVEITAKLFFELAPDAVRRLLAFYRRQNEAAFSNYPLSDYWRQVESVIAGSEESYQKKEGLSGAELEIYQSLTPAEKSTFRICRSLARLEGDDDYPPPMFYLSSGQLEMRILETRMMAWRIMVGFTKLGIVEKAKNGARWAKETKPSASVWRWLL